jgi:hypothetical protein
MSQQAVNTLLILIGLVLIIGEIVIAVKVGV